MPSASFLTASARGWRLPASRNARDWAIRRYAGYGLTARAEAFSFGQAV